MDITICVLDINKNLIKIAGAGQKAIVFKNNNMKVVAGDYCILGDIGLEDYKFAEVEIAFKKGDSIYLQSDGFTDQFKNKTGEKFGTTRYLELLKSIQNKTMNQQQSILINSYDTWKGNSNQIDDIIIWGLRY